MMSKPTRYSIECPNTEPGSLRAIVKKHVETVETYATCKPVAAHTVAAFDELLACLPERQRLILDSGCGTGRSSLRLGRMFPNHTVVGVDKSIARLSQNARFRNRSDTAQVQQAAENVWLVRAELVDFWQCSVKEKLLIEQHFLLYPNPYPKMARLKHRWYAHPSFPILLQLRAGKTVLRSNWKQYLIEFADCVSTADTCYSNNEMENFAGPYCKQPAIIDQQTVNNDAWTNFEEKYFTVGEPTFELILHRSNATD
jgi:tRNA (guanine-N7-)-methyltransferase